MPLFKKKQLDGKSVVSQCRDLMDLAKPAA